MTTLAERGHSLVLGAAEHRYEWVEGWAKLPEAVHYGNTHGVVVDSQGRIIVHTASDTAIIIFDSDGQVIKWWGSEFAAGAHGLQLRKEDNAEFLYLADIAQRQVVKTTLDGEVVFRLPCPMVSGLYEEQRQYCPTNVAFAPNGDLYVADGYGLGYIHQYNSKGRYLRSFGGPGTEPGKLSCPHGLWVDTRAAEPDLIVADRGNERLQIFTLDGRHKGFVAGDLRRPCHFDERDGDLLIPDLYGRLTILDQHNHLITHLGDNPGCWKTPGWPDLPKSTWQSGKFIAPHAACWDADGNIFVVEWVPPGRVTKLRRV